MKGKYAKLLGLSGDISDHEIIAAIDQAQGDFEMAGKRIEISPIRPVRTGYGDDFNDLPIKQVKPQ